MNFSKYPIVIVISRLIALRKEQTRKLNLIGICACCLCEETTAEELHLMRTETFEYVFTSPEALSGSSGLSLDSDVYRQQLVALVVGEAHCITEW